jgi:hypothetical protein
MNLYLYFIRKWQETVNLSGSFGHMLLSYFLGFGWLYVLLIVFMVLVNLWVPAWAPWVLLILIIALFFHRPLRFVYVFVTGSNSLRMFLVLFIITQFAFSGMYYVQFRDYICVEENAPTKVADTTNGKILHSAQCRKHEVCSENSTEDKFCLPAAITNQSELWYYIVSNTFYTGLIQEGAPLFTETINTPDHPKYQQVYMLVILQVFLSWIYLGVLIASLYQKLKNE